VEKTMQQGERYWSTDHVAGKDALRYWCEVVAEQLISCVVESDETDRFTASLSSASFGLTTLHFARSSPCEIRRTRDHVARNRSDRYYLIHRRQASIVVEQHGRVAVVEPGDCVLVSGRSPYRIRNKEPMEGMSIAIPAELLLGWLPEPDLITARTLHGGKGWGHSLAATLANFQEGAPPDLALSTSVVVDQILAHLAIAAGANDASTTRHHRTLFNRLANTLSDRFCEADLDPSSLAQEHGLSKRYVHMIFAKAGTSFCRELERIRLERAKRLLEDRRFDGIDIMEIALRCGFRDSSGFSRRFRDRYGTPPSLYRRQRDTHRPQRALPALDQAVNCG
jgi:AraC-like DNA-binding protein